MPSDCANRCSSAYDVSLARCDQSRPCPGEFGRVDQQGHPVGRPAARSAASSSSIRQARTWPASTYAFHEPPGRTVEADLELAHAGAHQPRHVLAAQAAAGHQQPGDTGVGRGPVGELLVPGAHARATSRPRAPRRARAARAAGARPASVSSDGVDRPVERPRHPVERVGEVRADLDVDGQVGVEEAERDALGARRPGSPRPSPTSRVSSPPVVVYVSLSRSIARTGRSVSLQTAETTAGLRPRARRTRGRRPRRPGPRRPRRHPATSRGCSTTTSSRGARARAPGLDPCSQWTS